MLTSLSNYLDQLTDRPTPMFSLTDVDGFPYEEFSRRQTIYTECESWYSGSALEEVVVGKNNKPIERYPVHINPIKRAVIKHVATLFGEWVQDDRPLVYPRILPPDDQGKEIASKAENVLYQTWWENNGRSLQLENGAMSQIYGGCIFRVVYDPRDPLRNIPLRIEGIHPRWFIGRPSATDMFRLREAWIVKPIYWDEAMEYGVPLEQDDTGWMLEHWTNQSYSVSINNQPVTFSVDGERIQAGGANPFGFVPVVYIPHWRSGGFYGENTFDNSKGTIKELNARVADFGDAVSVDSHSYLGMRNVQGSPQLMELAPGYFAFNLGQNPNITGQENNPDLFDVRKPSASGPMKDLINELENTIRRDMFVPAIADGEDEGSQRSGLTLAMRMWPLVSHTNLERVFWTVGLDLLNRMILRILFAKGESEISKEMLSYRIREEWSPSLPRDREAQVAEAVARMTSKIGSPETMLEMLGDVDDIDQEVERILDFQKKIAEITAMAQPFNQPGFGNNPNSKGKPAAVPQQTQTGKMQTTE
jgi:hypothetical protein